MNIDEDTSHLSKFTYLLQYNIIIHYDALRWRRSNVLMGL